MWSLTPRNLHSGGETESRQLQYCDKCPEKSGDVCCGYTARASRGVMKACPEELLIGIGRKKRGG